MDTQIINILDDLAKRFGIAIDWTSQNVIPYLMDIVNRYISYQISLCYFWIIICTIILLGLAFLIYRDITKGSSDGIISWIAGVLVFFVIVFILGNIAEILKCTYVPEVAMIEFIKEWMKASV